MTISKVARWFISPKIHAPLVGAFQDCLVGIAEFTKEGLTFNKWHAMQMLVDVESEIDRVFKDKTYTNRQLVSRLLPKINVSGKTPTMYKEQYAQFIKYNPADIKITIERGELKSGIIDKSISGQGVPDSIFHIIANEYGNDKSLETVYNLQQLTHKFFLYHGFTVGIADCNISEEATRQVKEKLATIILNSRKITQRLNSGKLIAPLGTELSEFYENEQLSALAPGDDFAFPILEDVDFASNSMMRLILFGSKGKLSNFISINGAIGVQTINGNRFPCQAGWGRTSPYFVRYDTEPDANGFISTSFREGVKSKVYTFVAGEARHGLISNALSTSVTGYQNRISIKNLESIIVDNLRKSAKGMNVIQPLYAETGIDPAKLEKVKFPTVMISNEDFIKTYKINISTLNPKHQNDEIQKLLDAEFDQLNADREKYRSLHTQLENHNPKEYVFGNSKHMPVNVFRVVEDVIYNNKDIVEQFDAKNKILDPKFLILSVMELCGNLGYAYLNEIQQKAKRKLPKHFIIATEMLQILIRSYLNYSYLSRKSAYNYHVTQIIQRITLIFKKSLIAPGTSVGIIAAQCMSEPMMQYVLDSKHRSGGQGGTKTNAIIRIQEILGARSTLDMKNPHMMVMVKPEYEHDRIKVQEIANHIEMMHFGRFISDVRIFFEQYGKPVHSKYRHEAQDIKEFEKMNYGIKIPGDLASWCIRFGVNKEELILKSMKLETIVLAIRRAHPELFVMFTPENDEIVYLRCYFRNSQIKQAANYYASIVKSTADELKKVIVRGIKDIIATSVVPVMKNIIQPDGTYKINEVYGIVTTGSNLTDILSNPYIDPYRTQSDSIEETERVFGITAARNKIMNEIQITFEGIARIHCTIFADEMCYSGLVTNIQKTGLQKRENANITLRVSFQTAIQVIQDAAIHGLVDRIGGISGPLVLGTNPSVGTTYNSVIVNRQFIEENSKALADITSNL